MTINKILKDNQNGALRPKHEALKFLQRIVLGQRHIGFHFQVKS